jgi:hypothetical protein
MKTGILPLQSNLVPLSLLLSVRDLQGFLVARNQTLVAWLVVWLLPADLHGSIFQFRLIFLEPRPHCTQKASLWKLLHWDAFFSNITMTQSPSGLRLHRIEPGLSLTETFGTELSLLAIELRLALVLTIQHSPVHQLLEICEINQ